MKTRFLQAGLTLILCTFLNVSQAQFRYIFDNFVVPQTTYTNVGPDSETIRVYADESYVYNGETKPGYLFTDFATQYLPALTDTIFVGIDDGVENLYVDLNLNNAFAAATYKGFAFYQGTPVNGYWGIGNDGTSSNVFVGYGDGDAMDNNFYVEAGQMVDSLIFILEKAPNSTANMAINGFNWIPDSGQRPSANPDLSLVGVCDDQLDVMFVLDNSNSIESTEYAQIRAGIINGLTTLSSSGIATIQASFVRFGTEAEQGPSDIVVDATSLGAGGTINTWINTVYGTAGPGGGQTNFTAALDTAKTMFNGGDTYELLVFFTDGIINDRESIVDAAAHANYLKDNSVHMLYLGAGQMGPEIIQNAAGFLTDYPSPIEYDNNTNLDEGDYRYMTDYSDLNIFVNNILSSCIETPVELIDFDAYADGCEVNIEWATASEINNDYFLIERSADGHRFETIGKVYGSGTSSEIIDYSFVDQNPSTSNFYRLKQVDFDGKYEYSEILQVKAACRSFQVFPTLFDNQVTIETDEDFKFNTTIIVSDVMGRKIHEEKVDRSSDYQVSIDLGHLNHGVYFLSILEDGVLHSTQKLVKRM